MRRLVRRILGRGWQGRIGMRVVFTFCAFCCAWVGYLEPIRSQTVDPSHEVSLTLGGDVMVGRYAGRELRLHGGPDPFAGVSRYLQRGDLTVVNLESPISNVDPELLTRMKKPPRRSVRFRIPTKYAGLMKAHGVDLAVLANNHTEDCGVSGIADTLAALDAAEIQHVGAVTEGNPFVARHLNINGHKVIVWAVTIFRNLGTPREGRFLPVAYKPYSDLLQWLPEKIRDAREQYPNALIMVSIHWGKEWSRRPSPGQVRLARKMVDSGASVVMGHHPHVLQPIEVYKGSVIFYSLGNLIFDMRGHEGRRSAIAQLRMKTHGSGWKVSGIEMQPIKLQTLDQGPRPATATESKRILEPLRRASGRRFQTPMVWKAESLVWQP